ncbi:hypothetical protein CsSME_00051627 [Camellia sinensis var. sinensis]
MDTSRMGLGQNYGPIGYAKITTRVRSQPRPVRVRVPSPWVVDIGSLDLGLGLRLEACWNGLDADISLAPTVRQRICFKEIVVGIAYLLAFESANNLAMSPAENIEYDRVHMVETWPSTLKVVCLNVRETTSCKLWWWLGVPHVRGAGAARAVISVAKIGPGKVGRTCRACSRMCGSGQRPICSKFFKY